MGMGLAGRQREGIWPAGPALDQEWDSPIRDKPAAGRGCEVCWPAHPLIGPVCITGHSRHHNNRLLRSLWPLCLPAFYIYRLEAQCSNLCTGGVQPARPQSGQIGARLVWRKRWQKVDWPLPQLEEGAIGDWLMGPTPHWDWGVGPASSTPEWGGGANMGWGWVGGGAAGGW